LPPVLADYPYIAQTTSSPADKRDVDASMGQPWTPEPVVIPTLTIPGLPAPLPPGFGVGSSHAHADASPYAQATGAVASVDLGQGVTVGSSKGESSAKQADGLVTAATTSTLTDVTIATLIHIASVTVTASITSAGPNTVKTSQQLVYSGVTVAGMPATIDNDGLHLAGSTLVQADQLKQVTDMLAPVLGPLHLSFVPPKTVETRNPDGSGKISVDGVGLLFYDDQSTDLSALVELGHSELKVRALPALPISIPTFVAPSLGDLGITTITTAPPIDTGVPGVGTHKTKRLTTITTVAGHVHLLILPFVALLAEISMVALVVQAYRWKREVVPDPQDLLAL
jgi:hypothetical protein